MALSKLEELESVVGSYGSVLVAFSGGVDSALVLKVARKVLGRDHAKAVTAQSESMAARELEAAKKMAVEMDVEHLIIETKEMENPNYRANSTQRCFFCKSELYEQLSAVKNQSDARVICDGSNLDDLKDFRPGFEAVRKYDVRSPLIEAKLTKQDVRDVACSLGLKVWNKPASPCLSSRIPHGEIVTAEKLRQIENGENYLKDLGFKVVRLRHLGDKARIELGHDEFVRLMDAGLREKVTGFIYSLGFKTVSFESYKPGSFHAKEVSTL